MSEAEQRLSELSPQKRALLEQYLLRRRAAPSHGISKRDLSQPVPVSPGQRQLLFLDMLAPKQPTYHSVLGMTVDGLIDVDLLERAVTAVVARHEVLRTTFQSVGDDFVQIVRDVEPVRVRLVDLSMLDSDERDAAADVVLLSEARRPFDLAADQLVRVLLIRLDGERGVLAFVQHHIAFDGWSDDILCDEVSELYAAFHEGREPALPALPLQFGDYAAWQRDRLAGPSLDDEVSFWLDYLDNAPVSIELPYDRPRPSHPTFDGAQVAVSMPVEVAGMAKRLCESEGATAFMVLVASVVALLYRWTGATDLVVGTPSANRGQLELEPLIGFFSNTLPIRVAVDGSFTFRELVGMVRARSLEAIDHQDLPFERLVSAVNPPRDPGRNPIFQVNVRAGTGGLPRLRIRGVTVTPFAVDLGISRFDLAVDLRLHDQGVTGFIEYNTALFDRATIERLNRSYSNVTAAVLSRPDEPLWNLPPVEETSAIRGSRRR